MTRTTTKKDHGFGETRFNNNSFAFAAIIAWRKSRYVPSMKNLKSSGFCLKSLSPIGELHGVIESLGIGWI